MLKGIFLLFICFSHIGNLPDEVELLVRATTSYYVSFSLFCLVIFLL